MDEKTQESHGLQSQEEKIEPVTCPHHRYRQGSYQENKKRILDALKRIEGQVRGIQGMVEEERYCVDVITQVAAARMALARISMILLEDHTKGCVKSAIENKESEEETIEELVEVVKKLVQ